MQQGRIRAIGIASKEPQEDFKDIKPIADTVPGVEINNWISIVGPKGMPLEIVAKLNKAINDTLSDPIYKEKLVNIGLKPQGSTPEALAEMTAADIAQMKAVIEKAGIVIK